MPTVLTEKQLKSINATFMGSAKVKEKEKVTFYEAKDDNLAIIVKYKDKFVAYSYYELLSESIHLIDAILSGEKLK